jgi:CBS domain-containing protein
MRGDHLRAKEIADEKHPFIYDDDLATRARAVIRDFALRILPVTDKNKRLLGKISRRDIMTISSSVSSMRVKGVMTQPKYVASMEGDALSTIREMIRHSAWYAPVVSSAHDATYRGVLSLEDFIRASLKTSSERLSKPVSEIMSKDVVACTTHDEVDNVWRLMQTKSFAGLPVVKKDKLVGIISQKDLLEHGTAFPTFESKKGRFRSSVKISSIMKTPALTLKPSATVADAAKIMVERNVGRIPVRDAKGKLVGIVDREDIVRLLIK